MAPVALSVVIPTYQRPDWIRRAVQSLASQTRIPDEVIAVARDTDTPTHDAIAKLNERGDLPFVLRKGVVSVEGFMPPVHTGLELATGDIIAVMDDDAEAQPDWAARMLAHYTQPDIGAVGGRCINMDGDRVLDVPKTSRVGHVSLLGKIIGDMYKEPTFDSPMDVSFLMGGCMSFRREIARRLEFDWDLNRVVATHYEVDLGLQVRNMGFRIVYDPKIAIRHYSAPRAVVGNRALGNADAVRAATYNETRIVLRRLPLWWGALFFARGMVVGFRTAPGVLPWIAGPIARRLGYVTEVAPAALRGRVHAAATLAGAASSEP